ncbi:MAG: ROK family protein [Actinomycetota bacterium]
MTEKRFVVGCDLGGTKTAVGLVEKTGKIVFEAKQPTPLKSAKAVIDGVIHLIDELFSAAGAGPASVRGIGLGVPGMVDFKKGIVVFSPHLPLRNTPFKKLVQAHYHLPTFLDNDASLAALGERCYGAGKGVSNLVMVTIGTGIGGGIILNDKIYRGVTGSAAEIGHMVIDIHGPRCQCGNFGCFEELASGDAIARRARAALKKPSHSLMLDMVEGNLRKITGEVVALAAKRGDKLARQILEDVGFVVGIGLTNIVNIFNPEMIILGGGVMEGDEFIIKVAREVVAKRALIPNKDVVKIVHAKLGNQAGILGAAALVLQERDEMLA